MSDAFAVLSDEARGALRRSELPRWAEPMLATLTDEPFSDAGWIFERKLDGVRCLVRGDGGDVRLFSRNRIALNRTYPELVEAFGRGAPGRFLVDGEIVAFRGRETSFARLQQRSGITDPERARRSPVKVTLYLFDVLHLEGHDVTALPLRARKRLLKAAFDFRGPLRYCAHRNEHGERLLEQACGRGWEGLIAKRADSRYVHRRSRDWLKLKCVHCQELVVVGFTEPKGSRSGFGALLLGYYRAGALRYAGRVGTGFDEHTLARLHARLVRLERATSPLDEPVAARGVRWVTPELVAEVAFTEWTRDGRLRHPRFLGLRQDKPAAAVVREEPAARRGGDA